jgi:hypothetical protein
MVDFVIETADTKLMVYNQTDPSPPADATNEPVDERIAVTAAVALDPRSVDQEERQTNHPKKKKRKTTNQMEIKQAPTAPPMLTRRVRVYPTRKQRVVAAPVWNPTCATTNNPHHFRPN